MLFLPFAFSLRLLFLPFSLKWYIVEKKSAQESRPCFNMVLASPHHCPKPSHSRFPWNTIFLGYNFFKAGKYIRGHLCWRTNNIDGSPLTQQIPDPLALLSHLLLHIDLLFFLPWEGHVKASTLLFRKHPEPAISWMRQSEISV